jgi:NADPH:quinone reductase-like Zn-dependent oxidoreductase
VHQPSKATFLPEIPILRAMPPSNRAAFLVAAKQNPLEVRPAPYTKPGPGQITIRNHAVATNPLDFIKQMVGDLMYDWVKYPLILGSDVAGEVIEVGKDVTRFKVGDRVVGHSVGMAKNHNSPALCGFQEYVNLLAIMTSPLPDRLPYEDAAVIPLGLSTAACALFQKDQLALQHPSTPAAKSTGKTLLVWGGSTSVGANAIQLAIAAGYEVVTTCSPRNFDFVKRLGAVAVFDYNSPSVVRDIKNFFKDKTAAGAISIGQGAAEACLDILGSCRGDKVLAMATYPMDPMKMPKNFAMPRMAFTYITGLTSLWIKAKRHGVRSQFIFGDTLVDNEVGPLIYETFLPQALADGSFVATPEPEVIGHGLQQIQNALNVHMKGVSAKKLVVTL